ncbi:ApeA N-terminal domain 1-containing protein [Bacillus cereus]|uniref:ApeA N-terminal domain 1-containing protein n=1 Tax=Bacillus cereus TaxID=1396 RepID=UPI00061DF117|nr:HEPN domain-containing protein [Bacillus cereus]AKE16998.1 hypothetical protein FORC5_2461 [Bacillus cereus]WNM97264.1 hypothetical protein RPB93_14095 [Bacillus cereus]
MGKKTKDFTMNDEFELRGHWWIPDNPENSIGGILDYNHDGIKLQLLGNLDDQDEFSKTPKYNIIQGITNQGDKITLCDGFQSKRSYSGFGKSQTLSFNKLIIGKHFNSLNEIIFHSLSISYSGLEDWMGFQPFTETTELKENLTLKKAILSYEFPPTLEGYISSKKTKIKTGCTFTSSGDFHKNRGYTHKATIDILPDEQRDLDWFFNITHEIQDFLTLLTNRAISQKHLKAKGNIINDKHKIRESFFIFSLYHKTPQEKEVKPFEMSIGLQMIKDDWENILNQWFVDTSYSARKIYLRNLYETEKTWETTYLDYTKTLESLHRDTAGEIGQFLSDDLYEPIKKRMIESIQQGEMENNDFNNLKNKLSSALEYAHHFGFERRIRDTFKEMDERIRNIIFPNGINQLKEFASNITLTRNYYTHYGEKPNYYFKDFDLYFVNSKLQVILFYYFCKRLKIKEDLIFQSISNDYNLVHSLKMETEQPAKQRTNS